MPSKTASVLLSGAGSKRATRTVLQYFAESLSYLASSCPSHLVLPGPALPCAHDALYCCTFCWPTSRMAVGVSASNIYRLAATPIALHCIGPWSCLPLRLPLTLLRRAPIQDSFVGQLGARGDESQLGAGVFQAS